VCVVFIPEGLQRKGLVLMVAVVLPQRVPQQQHAVEHTVQAGPALRDIVGEVQALVEHVQLNLLKLDLGVLGLVLQSESGNGRGQAWGGACV
jgi:hypothetical protein